jgi:hypothetical protein
MPRGRCLLGGAVMARRSLLLVVPDLRRTIASDCPLSLSLVGEAESCV